MLQESNDHAAQVAKLLEAAGGTAGNLVSDAQIAALCPGLSWCRPHAARAGWCACASAPQPARLRVHEIGEDGRSEVLRARAGQTAAEFSGHEVDEKESLVNLVLDHCVFVHDAGKGVV